VRPGAVAQPLTAASASNDIANRASGSSE